MSDQAVSKTFQVVVFSLKLRDSEKKESFGVGIDQVKEIRTLEKITTVPRAPHYVKGIMNLRGQIIPVIDMKQRLGFSATKEETSSRILVTEIKNNLTGFLVDEVDRVIVIPIKDVETIQISEQGLAKYVKGVAKSEGNLITLIDLQTLLEETISSKIQEDDV